MIYSSGGFLKDSNSFQIQHSSSILDHWCMMIDVAEFQWWRYVTDICDVLERPTGQTGRRCLITWRCMVQPQQQISTYINQACCVLHKSFNHFPLHFGHPCCVFRWCSLPTTGKLVCCRSTWPGDLSTSTTSTTSASPVIWERGSSAQSLWKLQRRPLHVRLQPQNWWHLRHI